MSNSPIGRLARRIRSVLGADDSLGRPWRTSASEKSTPGTSLPEDYDQAFNALQRKLPSLKAEAERSRQVAGRKFLDLADSPPGRQEAIIRDSSPSSLVALAARLLEQSYDDRFTNVRRSLELARLAHRSVCAAAESNYLSECSYSDLEAEALLHLGNALRLNASTAEAERTFNEAERLLRRGTRDRHLEAMLFSFRGSLLLRQRRLADAAQMFDGEIEIRRSLDDPGRLGIALIDRGAVACHAVNLEEATRFLREGALIAGDDRIRLLAMTNLAEALARDGRGLEAWRATCTAEAVAGVLQTEDFSSWITWCKGLAYHALGRLPDAHRELESALESLVADDRPSSVATLSIDLSCVLAALGRFEEMRPLISSAYRIFSSEQIDQRVLQTLIVLREAIDRRKLNAGFAKKVATFVARSRYDCNLRLEHPQP